MSLYCDLIFPLLNNRADPKILRNARQHLVSQAQGTVLEIGFGTGKTLPFYQPSLTRLSIIEPSQGMNRKTANAIREAPFPVEQRELSAARLPFADATFDYVVSVKTLCTVDEPEVVLNELRRVVKPKGRLLFLEHVLSNDDRVARWQHRLNPLQRAIGCGCNLNRDSVATISNSGFNIQAVSYHNGGTCSPGTRFMPTVVGEAIRAS